MHEACTHYSDVVPDLEALSPAHPQATADVGRPGKNPQLSESMCLIRTTTSFFIKPDVRAPWVDDEGDSANDQLSATLTAVVITLSSSCLISVGLSAGLTSVKFQHIPSATVIINVDSKVSGAELSALFAIITRP